MGVGGGALGGWSSCGLEGDEAVLVGEEDEVAASSQSSGVGEIGGLDLLGLLEGEIESFLMDVSRPGFQLEGMAGRPLETYYLVVCWCWGSLIVEKIGSVRSNVGVFNYIYIEAQFGRKKGTRYVLYAVAIASQT